MTILEKLQRIQLELKAPKSQFNSFGKYKYRSAEDILEGIKPFEEKYSVLFKISDELREVAGKVFVHSEAKVIDLEVTDRESSISSTAQAIIDFDAKGMQMPQRYGSASSYGKKYALGNLFLIDDTQDSDATNTHDKKPFLNKNTPQFKKVLEAIENGYTLDNVKSKYNLSKEVESLLTKNQ